GVRTMETPGGEIHPKKANRKSGPGRGLVFGEAPRKKRVLAAAEKAAKAMEVEINGRYRHEVPGHNVVARLDRGTGRAIVISTPVTSWFTSTCERGPGIAGFLATARLAKTRLGGADLVLVATAGHEIGHGGMDGFIRKLAPAPSQTLAWAHFGASLACFDWRLDGGRWVAGGALDTRLRVIARSQSMDEMVRRHFAAIGGTALVGDKAAVGELRDVHAAGYPHFFCMAGLHGLFHPPADSAAGPGPDILAPVAEAFATALEQIAATSAR